jgi:hypothetical protein
MLRDNALKISIKLVIAKQKDPLISCPQLKDSSSKIFILNALALGSNSKS